MTVSQKNIVPGVLLTGVLATLHASPTGTIERIINATITNDTAGVIAVTVHIISSGGSASSANKRISARNIAAGETYTCPELIGRVLQPGDFIQALGNGLSMDVSAFTQV